MTAITPVVLAGGDATRFDGGDKLLARIGGSPVLGRAVEAARAGTGTTPVVAVGSREREAAYRPHVDDVVFAHDDPGFAGPLAGVIGALERVSTPWVFVVGGDTPLLDADAVRWLVDHRSAAVDAVVVRHPDGTRDPLHAGYRCAAVEQLAGDLPAGAGVRALLDGLDAVTVVEAASAPDGVRLAASMTNVNTRADLDAVRRRLGE